MYLCPTLFSFYLVGDKRFVATIFHRAFFQQRDTGLVLIMEITYQNYERVKKLTKW